MRSEESKNHLLISSFSFCTLFTIERRSFSTFYSCLIILIGWIDGLHKPSRWFASPRCVFRVIPSSSSHPHFVIIPCIMSFSLQQLCFLDHFACCCFFFFIFLSSPLPCLPASLPAGRSVFLFHRFISSTHILILITLSLYCCCKNVCIHSLLTRVTLAQPAMKAAISMPLVLEYSLPNPGISLLLKTGQLTLTVLTVTDRVTTFSARNIHIK